MLPATSSLPNFLPGSLKDFLVSLLVCTFIAGLAVALHRISLLSVVSPMIVAVVAGMALNGVKERYNVSNIGLSFVSRPLLRFAIVLLGFQLTWGQVHQIGLSATLIVIVSLAATLLFTIAFGWMLGVNPRLTRLIAAGTSVCGASAIVATNISARANDEDVAYALACVTLCGTVAMFTFPLLMPVLRLDENQYGLWAGSAIHEVAQVIGAAFQAGSSAGEYGTVAKLIRVVLLAPVVVALGFFPVSGGSQGRGELHASRFPLFILGFLGAVTLNSLMSISTEVKSLIASTAMFCLTMALAAIGLAANIRKLREHGFRPLLLAIVSSIFIAGLSVILIKLVDR